MKFNVKTPEYTNWSWSKIAVRVIFPPIVLWDLLKWGINKLLGRLVSHAVLPAQDFFEFTEGKYDVDCLNRKNPTLIHECHTIVTHDGAELDAIEIWPNAQEGTKPQKYIVNFVGNGCSYEEIIDEMQADAEALNINVVGFNFRGVSKSTGCARSAEDLVTDGIAQVQRLLDQGVESQNIILKGHSLGGGVASLVAHHFYKLDKPVYLFNNRSFSSITNFIVALIRSGFRYTGHMETPVWKILGWLSKPFIKLGLALTKWEINAGDAFNAIPEKYREYILVRTKKTQRNPSVIDDPVIRHYASIHLNVSKNERTEEKRNRRKMNCSFWSNGHCVPLSSLHNASSQTGDNIFREFVKGSYKK